MNARLDASQINYPVKPQKLRNSLQAAAAKHSNLRDVLSLFFRDDITAWCANPRPLFRYRVCLHVQAWRARNQYQQAAGQLLCMRALISDSLMRQELMRHALHLLSDLPHHVQISRPAGLLADVLWNV